MRLDGRLERLEKAFEVNRNATANQKKVCEPVDICAMEAIHKRMTAGDESGGRDLPDADILKIIESMAKRFRRDINFNAATCPEYDRMDENAREGLGRKWIEYVTGVINELDSLKA